MTYFQETYAYLQNRPDVIDKVKIQASAPNLTICFTTKSIIELRLSNMEKRTSTIRSQPEVQQPNLTQSGLAQPNSIGSNMSKEQMGVTDAPRQNSKLSQESNRQTQKLDVSYIEQPTFFDFEANSKDEKNGFLKESLLKELEDEEEKKSNSSSPNQRTPNPETKSNEPTKLKESEKNDLFLSALKEQATKSKKSGVNGSESRSERESINSRKLLQAENIDLKHQKSNQSDQKLEQDPNVNVLPILKTILQKIKELENSMDSHYTKLDEKVSLLTRNISKNQLAIQALEKQIKENTLKLSTQNKI